MGRVGRAISTGHTQAIGRVGSVAAGIVTIFAFLICVAAAEVRSRLVCVRTAIKPDAK